MPVHVVDPPNEHGWWEVHCDRHGVISKWASRAQADKMADQHRHCTCPDLGGPEFGDYVVDLCHSRGVHDPEIIAALVSQGREDVLGLAEQIVNEALGPDASATVEASDV